MGTARKIRRKAGAPPAARKPGSRPSKPERTEHLAPGQLAAARKTSLPRTVEPQLATLVDAAPEGDEWVHELKLDGYRIIARVEKRAARLFTRAGNDWTDHFPSLAQVLGELPVESALLDGEAVVLDAQGRSSFQALQGAIGGGRAVVHLFLFDLMYLNGYDVRAASLLERKELLRALIAALPERSPLRFSDHVAGPGSAVLAEACRLGAEGIVCKRADADYRSGRTRTWLKVKCTRRQEFVIAGFTDPAGSRVGLGALLLAAHDAQGNLVYTGKVGTGFDAKLLQRLRKDLGALERPTPAMVGAPRGKGNHWVEPRLVGEVSFSEWTNDGRIRHPAFVGLREDKSPRDVVFEREQPVVGSSATPPPPKRRRSTRSR